TSIHSATDDLGTLTGGSYSFAQAIDSSGRIAGYSGSTSGDRAFRYSGGVMSNLGTFSGDWSYGYGINNLGRVVGGAGTHQQNTHAFLYDGTQKYDLGTLSNNADSWGQAINNSGRVVGYGGTSSSGDHAFVWVPTVTNGTSGKMTDIGTLGGSSSYAWSINDNNAIVGSSNTAGDVGFHAFRYLAGSKTDLGTFGGTYSEAFDINLAGDIVGTASDSGGVNRAFLYSAGVMYDLNSLIPSGSGWTLVRARALNDSDQIIGFGTSPSGEGHAFLLTPILTNPIWSVDAGGLWSQSGNWSNGIPDAITNTAIFASAITAPCTVT